MYSLVHNITSYLLPWLFTIAMSVGITRTEKTERWKKNNKGERKSQKKVSKKAHKKSFLTVIKKRNVERYGKDEVHVGKFADGFSSWICYFKSWRMAEVNFGKWTMTLRGLVEYF